MTGPRSTREEQIIEAPETRVTQGRELIGYIKKTETKPVVTNIRRWIAQNTGAITVTDFVGGYEGQTIKILGDGFTTIAHNANIKTAPAADRLLAVNKVYTYTLLNGVWIENVDDTGGGGGGGAPTNAEYVTKSLDATLTAERVFTDGPDVTGDWGTANQLIPRLTNTGVGAGTYPKVTVDVKGRVTAGAALLAADLPAHTHAEADVTGLVADLAAKVPTSRTIGTNAPLSGGGDLSADRTLSVATATTAARGVVKVDNDSGGDPVALTSAGHGADADPHPQYALDTDLASKVPTSRQILTNAPLSGGGDLSADRTISLDGAASGQLGGNYPGPDVRGIRETSGPTLLTLGAIADGEYLKRSGANVVGGTPSAAVALSTAEFSLGPAPIARRNGKCQITGLAGLVAGKHVMIQQAVGPYTNKGTRADEAELDVIKFTGKVLNATTIDVYWESKYRVRGNYKVIYFVSA